MLSPCSTRLSKSAKSVWSNEASLDQTLFADLLRRVEQGESMRVVLCGEYERHVYETRPASAWSRVQAIVGWQDLWQSNAVLQSIAKQFGATALQERLVVPPKSEDM